MHRNYGVMVGPAIGSAERRADADTPGSTYRDDEGRCCHAREGGYVTVCGKCKPDQRSDAAAPATRPSVYDVAIRRHDDARTQATRTDAPPTLRPLSLFEIAKRRADGGGR